MISDISSSVLVAGQVLTTQAAVEAAISAVTSREETKQSSAGEENNEGEPQAKRPALEVDFSSLVKEAVFDSQQVLCFHCSFQKHVTSCNSLQVNR